MFCAPHCLPCLSNNISSQDIPLLQRRSSRINEELVEDTHGELVLVGVKIGKRRFFGGYADVFEGEYHATDGSGAKQKVAIKCLRIHVNDDAHSDFKEAFKRETRIWSMLRHKNIVQLLGITSVDSSPSLVSPWMGNGTIVDYLKKHPSTDRLSFATGIAEGLEYVHNCGVVHSDLKGDNILVDSHGNPVISDFGTSRLLVNNRTVAGTKKMKGNVRWMAIELMKEQPVPPTDNSDNAPHNFHTKESDIWAFGMVIYELLSGRLPFHDVVHEPAILNRILSGSLPTKPTIEECSDKYLNHLWITCTRCWASNPEERPNILVILEELRLFSSVTVSTPPKTVPLSESAAKQKSDDIDCNIMEDARLFRRECKILLLGSGESGKSTVVKQMKIIHQNGFTRDELMEYRTTVYNNLLESAQAVVLAMRRFGLDDAALVANRSNYEKILEYRVESSDPVIARLLDHTSEFYLMDSASYFFAEALRVGEKDYVPTETDVLRARQKSTGIAETRFRMGQLSMHMFDVGGQRSERKKWIHCFEGVTSIIFCTALSEYDQVLLEDARQNRMIESLVIFESVVNSRWFLRTSIILFLNKIDVFKMKLPRVPLERYFPEYMGGADINKAAKYILWRFMQANRARLSVFPHLTQATDTGNIRLVFAAVKETVLQNALKDSGIL